MPKKPNYNFEKRRKEAAKQQKKAEKLQRKRNKGRAYEIDGTDSDDAIPAATADASPDAQ